MYKLNKNLGQNFLINDGVKHLIVNSLDISNNDMVVEIGAGVGALTQLLTSDDHLDTRFFIIEYDQRFVPDLQKIVNQRDNFEIINVDILEWLPQYKFDNEIKIIGSLPYYITSPILHSIVKTETKVRTCVFLLQKEVGRKIVKKQPDNSYLSCFLQTFYDIKIITNVAKGSFRPVPKVDSCVIKMILKNRSGIDKQDIIKYEHFLHKAFSSPRKMLNKVFSKDILHDAGVDDKLRPQHLSMEKYIELFYKFKKLS